MYFVFVEQILGDTFTAKIIFILLTLISLINFLCFLLLSLFKVGYEIKKRALFIPIMFSEFLFICSLCFFANLSWGYPILFLSVGVFLTSALFSVRVKDNRRIKKSNQDVSSRNLARMLDKAVSSNPLDSEDNYVEDEDKNSPLEENAPIFKQGQKTKMDKKRGNEIDFSHVKNVMEKMNYYPLSPSEKKIITDLETSISLAENEGADSLLKSKINDGLGALLKIMSKYGI